MFEFLQGYKFYAVSAIVVAIGVAEGVLGLDVPGVTVGADWMGWVITGLGMAAGRSAIAKIGK